MQEKESVSKLEGKFKYYYQKTLPLQSVMMAGIILITLLQKPSWCVNKGKEMLPDCSADINGDNHYYLMNTFYLKPRIAFLLAFGLMYLLLTIQVLKV